MTGREAGGGGDERPVLRLVTGDEHGEPGGQGGDEHGQPGGQGVTGEQGAPGEWAEPALVHSIGPDDAGTGFEAIADGLDEELLDLLLTGGENGGEDDGDAGAAGPDLDFLLVPLMVEAERQMRSVRRALDAEMWASELLGMLELGAPEASTPVERETVVLDLAGRLVEYAVQQGTLSGLAMLRTLSVIGPAASRAAAVAAAAGLVAAGLHDRAWAASLGRPAVGRSWRFRDPDGSQESVTVVFGYGKREHALTVLIDHERGGGVQDCWIGEDPDAVLAEARAALAEDGIEVEFVAAGQVRDTLTAALGRPECPETDEEIEDVALCRALLQARVDLLVSNGDAPGTLEG